jgi:hypothetical protein
MAINAVILTCLTPADFDSSICQMLADRLGDMKGIEHPLPFRRVAIEMVEAYCVDQGYMVA